MLPNDPDISEISNEETRAGFLSGIALARKIRKNHPSIPIILISQPFVAPEAKSWAQAENIPFVYKTDNPQIFLLEELGRLKLLKKPLTPKAFIIHGHDERALTDLKAYIKNKLKWRTPIVLREQPNHGKTIIEKFEEFAHRIDWVFVLMTPADKVLRRLNSNTKKRRARQNVIFELGFFYGYFGRKSGRIIVLYKGSLELPSDIQGVAWINIDRGVSAVDKEIKQELGRVPRRVLND